MVRGTTPVRQPKENVPVIPSIKKPAGAATGCDSQPHSLWVRLFPTFAKWWVQLIPFALITVAFPA